MDYDHGGSRHESYDGGKSQWAGVAVCGDGGGGVMCHGGMVHCRWAYSGSHCLFVRGHDDSYSPRSVKTDLDFYFFLQDPRRVNIVSFRFLIEDSGYFEFIHYFSVNYRLCSGGLLNLFK